MAVMGEVVPAFRARTLRVVDGSMAEVVDGAVVEVRDLEQGKGAFYLQEVAPQTAGRRGPAASRRPARPPNRGAEPRG